MTGTKSIQTGNGPQICPIVLQMANLSEDHGPYLSDPRPCSIIAVENVSAINRISTTKEGFYLGVLSVIKVVINQNIRSESGSSCPSFRSSKSSVTENPKFSRFGLVY